MIQPETQIPDRLASGFEPYNDLGGAELLAALIGDPMFGRIAVVSSFGVESAVLLSLVAAIDSSLPVIFLNTGKHFPETLDYVEKLATEIGIEDLRIQRPDLDELQIHDHTGDLWKSSPNACCELRKTIPLNKALEGFDSWISGRKRYHGDDRSGLDSVEWVNGRYKINPLAHWAPEQIRQEFKLRDLPAHPLLKQGYQSIGCAPCTRATRSGEGPRDGRWADQGKIECGIHNRPVQGLNI